MPQYLSVWSNAHSKASKKSEILDIAVALRERAPWQVARHIFEEVNLEVGPGWESVFSEITSRENFDAVNLDELYSLYVQHICCGEKSLRIFELGTTNAEKLRDYLTNQLSKNRVTRPRSRGALSNVALGDPELVCAFRSKDAIYGIFSAIRRFEERVEISHDEIPEAALPAFAAYDEIIAVKNIKYEAFGIIWLPDNQDIAEIRVDTFVDETAKGLGDFHQKMYAQLHGRTASKSILSPTNLFGAIKGLYDAKQEGIVMELAFATTTGSVKHERMRSHASLRQEIYHVGGIEALATEIEPFRIGLRWRRQNALTKHVTSPELHLDGLLSMVAAITPELPTAAIRKAATFEDFEFVRSKLLEHA